LASIAATQRCAVQFGAKLLIAAEILNCSADELLSLRERKATIGSVNHRFLRRL
jgi:hypothetical protein